ncbi:MAG: 4Fe-4S dicluster domain-containing protein [Deltaproteobacteria bacterium]
MNGIRLLIDTSKCIGCKACQVACQQWHSLPAEDTAFTGSYQNPRDLSAANLTVTKFAEYMGTKLNWFFFKDQCRHCDEPPCMEHCRLKAIVRQADGAVRIDPSKCFPEKCFSGQVKPCQAECKYHAIPRYTYVMDGSPVKTKMRKCDFCYDRLNEPAWNAQSRKPACQLACSAGAISFGAANLIMEEARDRVDYLKTHGFASAKLYPGDSTHILWVLVDDKERYGQK